MTCPHVFDFRINPTINSSRNNLATLARATK